MATATKKARTAPRGRRASAQGRVMSPRHLGCVACRIRLHATAPEVGLLEGMCPVCGARLKLASSVLDLMGFRLFDLSVLSDQESSEQANVLGRPVDLVARREPVAVRDALDGRTRAR